MYFLKKIIDFGESIFSPPFVPEYVYEAKDKQTIKIISELLEFPEFIDLLRKIDKILEGIVIISHQPDHHFDSNRFGNAYFSVSRTVETSICAKILYRKSLCEKDAKYSVLFELINLSHEDEYRSLQNDVLSSNLSRDDYAIACEKIEARVLRECKVLTDIIDPSLMDHVDPKQLSDLSYDLEIQENGGHTERCRQQWDKIIEMKSNK